MRPGRAPVALLGALGGLAPCSPVLPGPFGSAVRAAAPPLLSLPPRRVPAELLRGDLTSSAPQCLPVLGC